MKRTCDRGISIVEALVGISILGLILIFVAVTMSLVFSTTGTVLEKTKAIYLAEEGHEILRYIRDNDWTDLTDLTNGTTYYFDVSTSTLATTTTTEFIEGTFTRSFVIENTERDTNDDFVESGGTDDTGGRVVTVTVTWGSESVSLTSILTNIHNI